MFWPEFIGHSDIGRKTLAVRYREDVASLFVALNLYHESCGSLSMLSINTVLSDSIFGGTMGLAVDIEHWEMPAAIGMATEGIRAKYNVGAGGGGYGASDYEIGSKLDGAKVLTAVERIAKKEPHLADWSMFAYASPLWNSTDNKVKLFETILNDWVVSSAERGVMIQQRTYERVKILLPLVAGGFALDLVGGAQTYQSASGVHHLPVYSRAHLIHLLVDYDSKVKNDFTDGFKNKRTRYYQNHWFEWESRVESIRTLLGLYDKKARKMFMKELENKTVAS
ncbi:hypothetical protein ACJYIM_002754 [Vibrio parahaemolyticus]